MGYQISTSDLSGRKKVKCNQKCFEIKVVTFALTVTDSLNCALSMELCAK